MRVSRVPQFYHNIIDLAVKMNMVLDKTENEELIGLLTQAAAQDPFEQETLFLQSTINYLRAIQN